MGSFKQTKSTMSNAILSDPRWFPFRYNAALEQILFVWIPYETHRAITFLSDLRPQPDQVEAVALKDINPDRIATGPIHYIQHSGMNGSTFLARVLSQWGVVNTLKEPLIIRDLVLQRSSPAAPTLLRVVTALLARPFTPGMTTIVKLSNIGNGMAGDMVALAGGSRLLCMHAPVEVMLGSLASRGAPGREASRRLFDVLRSAGAADFDGITDADVGSMGDLQRGALAWLAMQRQIWDNAKRFGAQRLRSIDSETLIANPAASIPAIGDHLGFKLDIEQRIAAGVFDRHSKTGEPFSPEMRQRSLEERKRRFGPEIDPIAEWTRKIAAAENIPWELPFPLDQRA